MLLYTRPASSTGLFPSLCTFSLGAGHLPLAKGNRRVYYQLATHQVPLAGKRQGKHDPHSATEAWEAERVTVAGNGDRPPMQKRLQAILVTRQRTESCRYVEGNRESKQVSARNRHGHLGHKDLKRGGARTIHKPVSNNQFVRTDASQGKNKKKKCLHPNW